MSDQSTTRLLDDLEITEIMPLPKDDLFSTPSNGPLECAEPGCKVDLDPHASFDCEEHWPGDFRCQRHSDEHLSGILHVKNEDADEGDRTSPVEVPR